MAVGYPPFSGFNLQRGSSLIGFSESLPRWKITLTRRRKGVGVHHLFTIRPAPAAPPGGASITLWIWFGVVLAAVVIGGFVLVSRR
jgi:hypothetical protein